jgi:hypothetical protein
MMPDVAKNLGSLAPRLALRDFTSDVNVRLYDLCSIPDWCWPARDSGFLVSEAASLLIWDSTSLGPATTVSELGTRSAAYRYSD